MFVLFLYGPAAAGKFTIGSQLAAELNLPLFHNHLTVDLAASLFEFGSEGFRNIRADVWRSAFREGARAGRSFIFTFHPEATVEPDLVDDLCRIVREPGGSIFFAELACSDATVLARLGLESRRQFGKLTDPVLYRKIASEGGFEFEGMPEPDIRVNTESTSAAESAAVIAAAVRERGLV